MEKLKKNEINDILYTAVEGGIIDLTEVQRKIDMTKKESYLNLHKEKYEIWQGTNGNWYTYLYDESKPNNRRLVKKSTLTKIENAIVDYYDDIDEKSQSKKLTLKTFYHRWLNYKKLETRSDMYIRRIDSDWTNHYLDTEIIEVPLVSLDYDTLKEWALKIVKEKGLTKKQYYNLTVIIRQSLEYAVQKNILKENPFAKVKIDKKLFKVQKKPDDKTQVFLIDEQSLIEAEAYMDFEETGYDACLAVAFCFQTGLRLGEVVALKETDIQGNYIHVQRMEIRTTEQLPDGSWTTQQFRVVDYTKSTAGDRQVYLSSTAREIIKRVLENNENHSYNDNGFLFLNESGRIHEKGVDCRIRKYCRHIGISEKATHKIRKTYISTLIDSGLNINEIRKLAGHEDERTTYGNYCFNRLSENQTESLLEKALCS